jgi:hypothetical protein
MSFLSLLGILVLLYSFLVFGLGMQMLKEQNVSCTSTKLYLLGLIVVCVVEIVLAWQVGPGFYGMQFFK